MSILSVENLCKEYPAFSLGPLSFSLEEAKITGFIGRNGAGKTTTIKSLFNFVHPDRGEIRFFGKRFIENEQAIKQRIGFATGGIDFYAKKKIRTITDTTKRFYANWDNKAYAEYLHLFKLDENKTPSELSEGTKVKYSLALALSHNAELLILDEPTTGLDPVSRDELLDIFLELCNKGISILFSTHITSDLDKCADNILYIKNGKLIADDKMKTFVSGYKVAVLASDEQLDRFSDTLIGYTRSKDGYTALVKTSDANSLGVPLMDADLESIMVHVEKE